MFGSDKNNPVQVCQNLLTNKWRPRYSNRQFPVIRWALLIGTGSLYNECLWTCNRVNPGSCQTWKTSKPSIFSITFFKKKAHLEPELRERTIVLKAILEKKSSVRQKESLELFPVHARHSFDSQITEKSALLGLSQVHEGVKGEAKIHPAGSESQEPQNAGNGFVRNQRALLCQEQTLKSQTVNARTG